MTLFNRLPGHPTTPPGKERWVLRKLPAWALLGTALLALPSLVARGLLMVAPALDSALRLDSIDIYVISLIVLHWTVLLTVGIAAFIILVMKGPAYVADAYPLQEKDDTDPPKRSGRPVW